MGNNILILTGRFGNGHISAADAIKEDLIKSYDGNIDIEIIDIVDYAFPLIAKGIYKNFNSLVSKKPNLYNALNKLAEESNTSFLSVVALRRIKRLVKQKRPMAIISVLPLSSQMVSYYKGKYGDDIPLYTYITDVCSHKEWVAENTDRYYVADKSVLEELVDKGVGRENIYVTGIPVRSKFKTMDNTRDEGNIKKLLILGGGLGLIPNCEELLRELNEKDNMKVTVVTGNNSELRDKLNADYNNINVIGFTDEIERIMADSDLILTKAGGITLFESIYMLKPIIVVNPFLSQEIKNARFIKNKNIGEIIIKGDIKPMELGKEIDLLINNDNRLEGIRSNMEAVRSELENFYIEGLKVC